MDKYFGEIHVTYAECQVEDDVVGVKIFIEITIVRGEPGLGHPPGGIRRNLTSPIPDHARNRSIIPSPKIDRNTVSVCPCHDKPTTTIHVERVAICALTDKLVTAPNITVSIGVTITTSCDTVTSV